MPMRLRLSRTCMLLLGVASALPSTACVLINLENDCYWTLTCPACDPHTSLVVTDGCGIYVSAHLGDDAQPGSKTEPVQTFARAFELAESMKTLRVYACAEEFEESLRVPKGMIVYGGLLCDKGWKPGAESEKTGITAGAGQIPMRLESSTAAWIEGTTRILDVRVDAADGQAPGESSIAVLVEPHISTEFERCVITAGNGADGWTPPDTHNAPAMQGPDGNRGSDACTADNVPGGTQVKTECGAIDSYGGKGGNGGVAAGDAGFNGQIEPVPNPTNVGVGGKGEDAGGFCMPGANGQRGADGEHGEGADALPQIGLFGYQGAWGRNGTTGLPGQGGGGGGGAKGGMQFCGAGPGGGASGGSGGGGGCGGRFGRGGGPGGASIGLIDLSGKVTLSNTQVHAGNGGRGGTGGMFQIGGAGGWGATGGTGVNNLPNACRGGMGGDGGNGGHGGGGLGGASIAVAYMQDAPKPSGDSTNLYAGVPGLGGGNPSIPITIAHAGPAGELVQLDEPSP